MKHIPERTCIACRKKGDKSNFIKVVLDKSGKVQVEKDVNLSGRGAYICKDKMDCILKCEKSKILSKVFKMNVPNEIYGEIKSEIESGKS